MRITRCLALGFVGANLLWFTAASADEPESPSDRPVAVAEDPVTEGVCDYSESCIVSNWDSGCACGGGCGACRGSRLTVNLIQTAEYGTSLALPLTLTPLNTLVSPVGLPNLGNILGVGALNNLGLLDNLGLLPGPVADVANSPVFDDDFQFQSTAGIGYQTPVGEAGSLNVGYTYWQNLHADLEQLDLQSHTPTVQYARQLTDRLVAAVDYSYSYYFLNQNSFVSQNRPGASLLLRSSDLWDFQIRGDYADANFRGAEFLNSDNYTVKSEAIRYLYGSRTNYLTFGSAVGYSDAALRAFSYQVYNSYVGGRWLFGAEDLNELRLTGSYGVYDFFGTDPLENVARQDRLFNANVYLGRYLTQYASVFTAYSFLQSESNTVRQNYDSSVVSVGVSYIR